MKKNFSNKQDKDIEKVYNKYYQERSIKNWVPFSKLIKDSIDKTDYPIKPGRFDLIQKSIFEVLNAYTNIVPIYKEKYESIMESVLTTSDDKSCLIMFNHDNFLTMTVFIRELYEYAKKLKSINPDFDDNLKNKIHTIVGPAITTQKQIRSINWISNVLKTVPARDSIPEIKPKLDWMRIKFIKHFLELSNTWGKIFLMAPTGTRDIIVRNKDWTLKSIMFQNDESISQTTKLIKLFAEKGNKVVLVWTNGAWLKRPWIKKVEERNNNRTYSDVYIDVEEFNSNQIVDIIKENKLMDTIAWLVKDNEWKSIAKTIDSELFDKYKKNYKEVNIEENNYKNHHFKDTTYKKIVRKLYTLLK